MSVAEPGRNDPCPCGSGRKYKKCCLVRQDAEGAARAEVRAMEGRLVGRIQAFALERWGEALFDEAWAEFFGWESVPDSPDDDPHLESIFLPWLVSTFVAARDEEDDEEVTIDWPSVPLALAYLAEHEAELSVPELRFLLTMATTPFSFHVVTGVTAGRALDVRDIFTGAERRVLEREGSRQLQIGDVVYARAVTFGDVSLLAGCAPLVIPPHWHTQIIDFRQRTLRRQRVSPQVMLAADFEVRMFYLDVAHAIMNPTAPVVTNTDGDVIRPTIMEFTLTAPPQLAAERLRPLTLVDRLDAALDEVERDSDGRLVRAVLTWKKRGNRKHRHWDNTVLGVVRIEPGRLVAETNSEARARRLRVEVEKRLGLAVDFSKQETGSVEEWLETGGRPTTIAPPREPMSSGRAFETSSPALDGLMREEMERTWASWLDERVPALGNRTPRQAAKTAVGRERLEALFMDFAARNTRQPAHMRVDIARLREALGLQA